MRQASLNGQAGRSSGRIAQFTEQRQRVLAARLTRGEVAASVRDPAEGLQGPGLVGSQADLAPQSEGALQQMLGPVGVPSPYFGDPDQVERQGCQLDVADHLGDSEGILGQRGRAAVVPLRPDHEAEARKRPCPRLRLLLDGVVKCPLQPSFTFLEVPAVVPEDR